jgi:orotate phosphoribosyltransferase
MYDVCNLEGTFRLHSGATSNEYFDKYRFASDPKLFLEVVKGVAELVPTEAEMLAGLEMGGVPLVTMLSQLTGLPALFVRRKAREYGTCKLAEGGYFAGKHVVLVEDVVTFAGQLLLSVKELRGHGANVQYALCVIDRESGGRENLAGTNVSLRSLYTLSELKVGAGRADPPPAEPAKAEVPPEKKPEAS